MFDMVGPMPRSVSGGQNDKSRTGRENRRKLAVPLGTIIRATSGMGIIERRQGHITAWHWKKAAKHRRKIQSYWREMYLEEKKRHVKLFAYFLTIVPPISLLPARIDFPKIYARWQDLRAIEQLARDTLTLYPDRVSVKLKELLK